MILGVGLATLYVHMYVCIYVYKWKYIYTDIISFCDDVIRNGRRVATSCGISCVNKWANFATKHAFLSLYERTHKPRLITPSVSFHVCGQVYLDDKAEYWYIIILSFERLARLGMVLPVAVQLANIDSLLNSSFKLKPGKHQCGILLALCKSNLQIHPTKAHASILWHHHSRNQLLYIEGILPKGPYPPCLHMADRALLAGYPRYM